MRLVGFFLIASLFVAPRAGIGQEVFSFGTGAIPDPRFASAASDADLNPMSALSGVTANDRGSWSSGTSFSLGDKVTINGVSYVR